MRLAQDHERSKRYEDAIALYDRLVARYPKVNNMAALLLRHRATAVGNAKGDFRGLDEARSKLASLR